jgi:hypothetical protein
VVSYLEALSGYPKKIEDPNTGDDINIREGFKLILSQNPPTDPGRMQLPSSLLRNSILLDVPVYT